MREGYVGRNNMRAWPFPLKVLLFLVYGSGLKNCRACMLMEALCGAARAMAETATLLSLPLAWEGAWLEERRPLVRVTLRDLEGAWTSDQVKACI